MRIVLGILAIVATASHWRTTYDAVLAGRRCGVLAGSDVRSCDYRVGESLHFELVGIGEPDAIFTVYKSDFDGDYYLSAGGDRRKESHDCAIVKPGKARPVGSPGDAWDIAFVSPRTGNVFKRWQDCIGK